MKQTYGLGHTVYFGCPWYAESKCDYGLISLPYLDGPMLQYKKEYGIEFLENLFEASSFNYLDPFRQSVIPYGGV